MDESASRLFYSIAKTRVAPGWRLVVFADLAAAAELRPLHNVRARTRDEAEALAAELAGPGRVALRSRLAKAAGVAIDHRFKTPQPVVRRGRSRC